MTCHIGAREKEVACMGTLTTNLHLMMSTFYKPSSDRYKILCEAKAFPSDQVGLFPHLCGSGQEPDCLSNHIRQQYAFASQAHLHGYDPKEAIIELSPREGEYSLRPNDILDLIAREGSSIALVLFSGIQYYTGQWFPMESITRAAKEQVSICLPMSSPWLHVVWKQGCICGWDLAHAIGNVPLSLHDWDADFAVWCTYKYLNSGPGGIGGLYIHEKWDDKKTQYVQSNKPVLRVM